MYITQGFDFLGFTIKVEKVDRHRRNPLAVISYNSGEYYYDYDKTLLRIKPSNKFVRMFMEKLKRCFDRDLGANATELVSRANPIIQGWCQFNQCWHSNKTCHKLDHYVYNLCWRWIKKTHRNKSKRWVRSKYLLGLRSMESTLVGFSISEISIFSTIATEMVQSSSSHDDSECGML
uniref:Putative group II intron maturase n=1 Tax=Hafniomonas laevis TaxID=436124 RepID=A0A0S2LNZ2_9CHLO|nr:putative group II intron maturase [Hafniomonas laevis]ALO63090.1 putative group II intron maturase [Hafniomonas laevis]